MKIVIVCYPTFGGSGVVATELGLDLSKKGHEIHFITYQQPVRIQNLTPNIHFHEVHVPDYDLFKYQPYELALSSKIVDVVKKYKIEATPTLIINDKKFEKSLNFKNIKKTIEKML